MTQDRFAHIRTVFLDRDGVLNEKMPEGRYVTCHQEFHVLPGVAAAIARLNRKGMRVIVVSNQRGVALGLYRASDVDSIHAGLRTSLESEAAYVDGIYYCPHDKGQCGCRKPLSGLFQQAVTKFPDIDPHSSIMIGDSLSDMEFGRRLEMICILIEGDPARRKSGIEQARGLADFTCTSLPEAIDLLLEAPPQGKI